MGPLDIKKFARGLKEFWARGRQTYPALRRLESLGWDLDAEASPEEAKFLGKLEEFVVYLDNNRHFTGLHGNTAAAAD
ncbi:hypothetical protein AWV79_03760 [Cupriavidus sp. UYMMa02A]|nr:hypothetical protein AWV79_03760 [Cupriavidus sp. UYMMa02A]